MDDPSIEIIVAIVAGGLLSVVYSVLESGLATLGDVKLKVLVEEDDGARARAAERLLVRRPAIMARLHTGLIASLFFTVGAVNVAFGGRGFRDGAVAVAVVGVAYLLLATTGKAWAARRAGPVFLVTAYWFRFLEWVVFPLSVFLTPLIRFVEHLVPESIHRDPERLTALRVEHAIDEGEEEGALEEDHAELLRSVLEFENTKAHEVMVPRTSTVAIELETALEDVLQLIVESGHSRYPVYRSRIDQIEGILCAKDIFRVMREGEDMESVTIADLVRKPVLFVLESQKIGLLFRDMQARGVHLAVVVDEFGGVSGVITLEDILEEIVGEIRDEHDGEEPRLVELGPNRYLADAGLSVSDVTEIVGEGLGDVDGDYDSLGGLVSGVIGRVPTSGEKITVGGFELIVREADDRRVIRVELVRVGDLPTVKEAVS